MLGQVTGMTAYRRLYIPGATYFFTASLQDPKSQALTERIDHLRAAFGATFNERPFWCDAMVVLPNHLHAVWTLPPGDSDFSTRWRLLKSRFSRSTGAICERSDSKRRKAERGLWQRRFWEHCIRDEADYWRHLHYCWKNPVLHGLVEKVEDWPFSSFHRDRRLGIFRQVDSETAANEHADRWNFGER